MIHLKGYNVNEKIFESSKSIIYRGVREQDNCSIIIKILKKDYPTPSEIARYKYEYTILNKIREESIIKPIELFKYENTLAIILKDSGGDSIKHYIKSETITLPDFINLALKINEALSVIHNHNIIHKDINPSNIIWNKNNDSIEIIDFELSTMLTLKENQFYHPNVLEGTLEYISPEQTGRMNRNVDYRSDYYSLGITFYEMLTGMVPFKSNDPLELVHHHIAKRPIPPVEIKNTIPTSISAIIMKLIEKNAEDRYQSSFGLKFDLEKCMQSLKDLDTVPEFTIAQKDISNKFQIPEKLYGREKDIRSLLYTFKEVAKSFTKLVMVTGYSGIGKSSLVREFQKNILDRNCYFISGKFDKFKRDIPYYSLIQAIQQLMKQILLESKESINQWKQKILKGLGNNAGIITDIIPDLELIIGKQPDVIELPPSESQNRFHRTFINFIKVLPDEENPLILFLDDLQWADTPSLNLLSLILSDLTDANLMIIGAYRNNEVTASHPLVQIIAEAEKTNETYTITLEPLNINNVNKLVSETLKSDPDNTVELTNLVYAKTNGNPFFIIQFLTTLNQENLIAFDPENGCWMWNTDLIKNKEITDNVVELLADKVRKMPEDTKKILAYASCIGNKFDLNVLSKIYKKSKIETSHDLWEAMENGIITPLDDSYKFIENQVTKNVYYKFCHDHIRQAVYSIIKDPSHKIVHLKIARLLLAGITDDELEDMLFDVLNHINIAVDLITENDERLSYVKLNLRAGKKAKLSSAYEPAYNFLKYGIQLLPENKWTAHYDMTIKLYLEASEAAYLCGNFEDMEELSNSVLDNANKLLDKIDIYAIKIQAYTAQNNFDKTKEIGYKALRLLGVTLPNKTNNFHVLINIIKTQLALLGKSTEKLYNLPDMTDPQKLATNKIFAIFSALLNRNDPFTFLLIILTTIRMSLKYGNCLESVSSYSGYGIILCGVLNRIDTGYNFGTLASRLLDKFEAKKYKVQPFIIINTFIRPWKEPLSQVIPAYLEAYNNGLENGDFTYAAISVTAYYFNAFIAGIKLEKLHKKMTALYNELKKLKQEGLLHVLKIWKDVVSGLLMLDQEQDISRDENLPEEDKIIEKMTEDNDLAGLAHYYIAKLTMCFLLEDFTQALKYSLLAKKYLFSVVSTMLIPYYYYMDSLIRLNYPSGISKNKKKKHITVVKKNLNRLKFWSKFSEDNFLHKYYIVKAELHRVLNQDAKAVEYYDLAIKTVKDNRYINDEAICYELTFKYWNSKNKKEFARLYFKNCHYCYSNWQAHKKLVQLENTYSELMPKQHTSHDFSRSVSSTTSTTSTTSTSTSHQRLDLFSIIKASNILSGEIKLSELLKKMIILVVENIGAQRGILVLENQGEYVIEAEYDSVHQEISILKSIPVSEYDNYCRSIVQYVMRTNKTIVINDGVTDQDYKQNNYIINNKVKSLLCMPLIKHERLVGLLYFENNITSGVFNESRLEILKLLSTQTVISIENALLYENLEQKVEERTRELTREKEKTDNLLLNILPVKVANDLKEYGKTVPRVFENVTIFFSDIVNFTDISSKLSPEEIINELNDIFTALDFIFEKNKCERIKTIGDAYLCVCGMPEKNPAHAENIVKSAIEIVSYMDERNKHNPHKWEIRIGIHSGKVVGGIVGIKKYLYDVFGDAINTASRMESNSLPMKINVSETTYTLVKNKFKFIEREAINVKGKGTMKMYYIDDTV